MIKLMNKVYRPLSVVIMAAFLASLAMQARNGSWHTLLWLGDLMGLSMVIFSIFKLFDIESFAEGFGMYDIIASRFKAYGFAYPFIELFLGLACLCGIMPALVYSMTLVIMSIGSIGVIIGVAKGLDVKCACLGTVLKVPLSTISIVEDASMAAMALVMLTFFR